MTIVSQSTSAPPACYACRDGNGNLLSFSMAFQPIVCTSTRTIFAYEALVRGPQQESAYSILQQVTPENRYAFDQACRVCAIQLASRLGIADHGARLSVNFKPGAVYSPAACIQRTLATAAETGFPLDHLIFEITEDERVEDIPHLQGIVDEYHKHGFALALDDFGAGHSGCNLLSRLKVNFVKLDANLVRDIDSRPRSQSVVRAITTLCATLNARVIGECVETPAEYETLRNCGVDLMQGYLFARPQFEALPAITWP